MIHTLLFHLHDTEIWASHLPRVPRKLFIIALIGTALVVLTGAQGTPGVLMVSGFALGGLMILPVLAAVLFALRKWNYARRIRAELLESVPWRGDEKVLDVGCGSGLLLNGAAMRLKNGQATGIDIWAPHSGGGNLELLWRNARAERVADKIEFKEADARNMPFEDSAFDVVLSSGALHHISHSFDDHDKAVREMVRVLKPGGRIILWDVTHMIEATAMKMKSMGIESSVKRTTSTLGFDMSIMSGRK